jgi:hypothetical protein
MAEYMIELRHTAENCSQILDEMMDYDDELLDMFTWGCKSGEHIGWALVKADNKEEVGEMLPPAIRDMAHIVEVNRFNAEEMRRQHEQVS